MSVPTNGMGGVFLLQTRTGDDGLFTVTRTYLKLGSNQSKEWD